MKYLRYMLLAACVPTGPSDQWKYDPETGKKLGFKCYEILDPSHMRVTCSRREERAGNSIVILRDCKTTGGPLVEPGYIDEIYNAVNIITKDCK